MNKNLLAAAKLQKAMSGLKTAYRDASPTDRRVIVATMKEVQAIHAQLVTAAEEEEEDEMGELESEEDEGAPDLSMDEMAEGEEPASMEGDESMSMDEAHMSEDDMMDESDTPAGESLPALDFGDDMDEESMSDDMDEESMDEGMGEESGFGGTIELDGLEIPEEYLSDLGDLGLLDLGGEGEDSEGMESEDFEAGEQEEGDEDEELAVAALALAASALRAMKVSADERESSQEEDPKAEADEEGIFHEGEVLDEEEIDALRSAGLTASAKKNDDVSVKLREISARLSKIRAPVKASANETVVSREKLEEMGASSDSILDQAPYTIKLLKASEDVRSAENGLRVSLGYRSEDSSDGPHGGQLYGIYRASGRIKLIAEVKNGKCVELRGAMNRLPSDEEKLIAKAVWNSVPTSASVKASANETVVSREKLEELGASSDSLLDQAPYTVKRLKTKEDARSAENDLKVSFMDRSSESEDYIPEGPHGGQLYGIYRASGRIKLIAEVKNGKCVELRGAMNRLPSDEEKLIAKAVWNSVPTSASVKASARNREAPRPLAPRARASR